MLALFLFACSPEGLPLAHQWVDEAQTVLPDEVQPDILERTRVAAFGAARWHPEDPPWTAEPPPTATPRDPTGRAVPVVDSGQQVGILVTTSHARLRLYLERQDLVLATWGWTEARVHPDRAAASGHVLLPPGQPVHALDRAADWVETALPAPVGLDLWIPAAAVDPVYDPSLPPPLWAAADERTEWTRAVLAPDAWLLDAPGGEALTSLGSGAESELSGWTSWQVGPEQRAHVPIVLEPGHHRHGGHGWSDPLPPGEIRAWVHIDDLRRGGCGISGFGCSGGCGGYGWRSAPLPEVLPAGSWLRDGPAGEVVGIITTDQELAGADADWEPMAIGTDWGEATVWFDADDLVPNPRLED